MWDCFFTPESQLPPEAGFRLFGPEHLCTLAACGALVLFLLLWLRVSPHRHILLRCLSLALPGLEAGKDLILVRIGAFSIGYLPLHLCSLSMLLCLPYSFRESAPVGRVLYSVTLPSALGALLFPNWNMFPLLHFQTFHSFLSHSLLLFFGLYALLVGKCRPGLGAILPSMGFLLALAVPVGLFNQRFHTNYMFLRGPSKGSPLEYLTLFPGKYGYLFRLLLLALSVVLLMNLPFILKKQFRKT